jgi:4-amino-4-deoxy-L-arabinose transferase-like glycosyltransferase
VGVRRLREGLRPAEALFGAWAVFAAAWLVASFTTHSSVPLVAFTTPAALLVGPALASGIGASLRADWRVPALVLPAAAAALALSVVFLLDWADAERVGDSGEQLRVWLFLVLAGGLLAVPAVSRTMAPALVMAALVLALPFTAAGLFTVSAGTGDDPFASPYSPRQARDLRDLALETAARSGGAIVIHPDLREAATWPFRDSGTVVIASRAPETAAILVWPAALPAPEGFTALEGNWSLTRDVEQPTSGFLEYLHWLFDRNTLAITGGKVAVYLKADE